ncbi:MAG: TIGR03986 family CRISPR-associated RAMP protein [Firmicutes bacterium]|nr:TIGR03986 family CRISPR-associated RAMP protein [Bacillota bacterium]
MAKGKVKRLIEDKGFGFIKPDHGGKYVFFHFSFLKGVSIQEGQEVEFEAKQDKDGRLLAYSLKVLGANAEAAATTERKERYLFLNPYNFVRTIQKSRPKEHPLGDCPPPPHDRYVGLTGRITCKAKVITPLFISDSHAVREAGGHRTYRFFQYGGKPAIPATSLRGMVRSVFEALTNSCFAVFQKDGFLKGGREYRYSLEYRASSAVSMVPARVLNVDEEKEAILELLDCIDTYPENGNLKHPMINAGLVKEAYPPNVKRFNPAKKSGRLPSEAYDGMRVAALVTKQPKQHPEKRYYAFHVEAVEPVIEGKPVSLKEDENHKLVYGWLHLTGPNIENKHDERLFFRWDDKNPEPPELDDIPTEYLCGCDPEVVEEYNHHLAGYWERLGSNMEELSKSLPRPSTFVAPNRKLKRGDLVYVLFDEKDKNRVKLLRPVAMPRLPYKHCREDFLPDHLKQRCTSYEALCPACRVFGWVHEKAEEVGRDRPTAYAGRVRFDHGVIEEPFQTEGEITLAILSTPKPTTTPFYLLDSNGNPNPYVDYDTEGARLRGRKMYRHHEKANPDEYQRTVRDRQNRTITGALKPGTEFTFTVEFENLAPVELGALLYALELEGEMVHRLGLAKPLGFGSVKVQVEKVKTIDWATRLSSVAKGAGWIALPKDRQEELKKSFLEEMRKLYGAEFDNVLKDLQSLLGPPPNPRIHYPRPAEQLNQDKQLQYEWFVGNNRRRRKQGLPLPVALPLASEDKEGLPLINKEGQEV